MSGLLVDEIEETIPSARETTGITFHYDAPGAEAPQAILLAVPPDPTADHWQLETLEAILQDTLELVRLRTVDGTLLRRPDPHAPAGQPPPPILDFVEQLLPAVFIANDVTGQPTIPIQQLTKPPDQFASYTEHCATRIDQIDVEGLVSGQALRGRTVTLRVAGCGFGEPPTPPTVDLGGVAVHPNEFDDTIMSVTVTIAPDAPIGPTILSITSEMGTAQRPAFEVTGPQAGPIQPSRFSQESGVVTRDATMLGLGLRGASIGVSGFGLRAQIMDNTSETELKLSLRVPASPQPNPTPTTPVWVADRNDVPFQFTVTTAEGTQLQVDAFLDVLHWIPKGT